MDRANDQEKRIRDLEAFRAAHEAECRARKDEQTRRIAKNEESIRSIYGRLNELPTEEEMSTITEQIREMRADHNRSTEEARKTRRAFESERVARLERDRSKEKILRWLIPIAVAVVAWALAKLG